MSKIQAVPLPILLGICAVLTLTGVAQLAVNLVIDTFVPSPIVWSGHEGYTVEVIGREYPKLVVAAAGFESKSSRDSYVLNYLILSARKDSIHFTLYDNGRLKMGF